MEDVTDAAFRRIIAQKGRPDVTYCEFTSADGLVLADEKGQKKLRKKLLFSEIERPVVAQLFTAFPEHMEQAAKLCAELGFDGMDINMGCPDRAIERSRCGAAMIKDPPLAREIIRAAKRGAGELPVSVKTRLGYNVDQLEEWLPELLAEHPAAVTIHARTRKEMSLVSARWERIKRAVEIRDAVQDTSGDISGMPKKWLNPRGDASWKTLIIGNGDVKDIADARQKAEESGADGVMLGRAIFGNPWLFANRSTEPPPQEKIQTLIEHTRLFEEMLGDIKNFAIMKKHFKAYVEGFDGAKELRVRLMETNAAVEAIEILQKALEGS